MLLARLFAEGSTIATVPAFSYSMYRYAAIMANATIVEDPADADLVYVCRPNNPTGELPDVPDVRGQLVIDEAYADYAGVDALDRLSDGAIILRTFSKAYGLAGARVGYAWRPPETIERHHLAPGPALGLVAVGRARAGGTLDAARLSDVLAERDRLASELCDARPGAAELVHQLLVHSDGRAARSSRVTIGFTGQCRAPTLGTARERAATSSTTTSCSTPLRSVLLDAPTPRPTTRHGRYTAETLLNIALAGAGRGSRPRATPGSGFYDHMLQQLAFHAGLDLRLEGVGDLETGDHHTVEDMMRVFGEALDQALGDRRGLTRYGEARVPMDEALAHAVVDLSGRATATDRD